MARPRKPTAIKQAKGTIRPCRENPDEPKLNPALPPPPDGLPARVAESYWRHGGLVLDMRVMTAPDQGALLGLAQAYCDWREAVDLIEANGGPTIEEPIVAKGGEVVGSRVKKHPAVDVRNDADKRYRDWCTKFGLTPADRARVSAHRPKETSALGKLLEMKRA